MSGGEDADLVRRCLSGDQRACRDLVRRYERPVYSVLMRVVRRAEDAEDLVQETFVKVFRALDRYDTERPFSAWIFTIASRLAIDHLRRRRVKTVSLEVSEPGSTEERTMDVEDTGLKPDEVTSHAEEEKQAASLIDSLPEHYRIVVLLRHQQDLSYEEIAEALNLPLGTVKARIHRARALLKDRLDPRPELFQRIMDDVLPHRAPHWLRVVGWAYAGALTASVAAIGSAFVLPGPSTWLHGVIASATHSLTGTGTFVLRSMSDGLARVGETVAGEGSAGRALKLVWGALSHPAFLVTIVAAIAVCAGLLWWMRPRERRATREIPHVGLLGL